MTVKRKNEKTNKSIQISSSAIKILCCYCDIRENCTMRVRKENTERMDITTYCSKTPNKPKSYFRKHKDTIIV